MLYHTSPENWTVTNLRKLWLDAYYECFPESIFLKWELVSIYICKPKIYELISNFGTTL